MIKIQTRKKIFNLFNSIKSNLIKITTVSKGLDIFFLNNKIYNNKLLTFLLQSHKRNISYQKNISILDLCINLNCIIPHYCYHFNLSIAGNCRMCLIELSTSQKPIVSCAINIMPNNSIKTNTLLVKRAREGIMEFLLVNHPLDCPICDQGGECDLQDQSLIYGSDRGRFYHFSDFKRSVTDFMCHPMIKVILTRCIHCTRCIRFLNEIEGDYTLGMLGRGTNSEIGLYTDSILISELSSNITDFCPVGALTIKPYALHYRAWDDLYFESIDLSDSLCVPIRVYSNFIKIIRLLPQYNSELKVSWIHEKTRYLTDGLNIQQNKYPLTKNSSFFLFSNLKTIPINRRDDLNEFELNNRTRKNNLFFKNDILKNKLLAILNLDFNKLTGSTFDTNFHLYQSRHTIRKKLSDNFKSFLDDNSWYNYYPESTLPYLLKDTTQGSSLNFVLLNFIKNFKNITKKSKFSNCPISLNKYKKFKTKKVSNFPFFNYLYNEYYIIKYNIEDEQTAVGSFYESEIARFSEENDILNFFDKYELFSFYDNEVENYEDLYDDFYISYIPKIKYKFNFFESENFWDNYIKYNIKLDLGEIDEFDNNLIKLNYTKISWGNLTKGLLCLIKNIVETINFKVFLGEFLDIFTLLKVKNLSSSLGSTKIYSFTEKVFSTSSNLLNEDFDSNYIFNIFDFNKFKNFFLFNLNLRFENPILNAKLRQRVIWQNKIVIFYLGSKYNLTYKYIHLGTTSKLFLKILEGRHYLLNFLKKNLTQENLLIYSSELKKCYKNLGYRSFFNYLKKLNKFFSITYLVNGVSSMGALDLSIDVNRSINRVEGSFLLKNKNKTKVFKDSFLYYIGCNQFFLGNKNFTNSLVHKISIYQHSVGDKYFEFIDFFLPSYSFSDIGNEYYINTFGILKITRQFFFPINVWVKDNLEIISIISKLFQNFLFKYKKLNFLVNNKLVVVNNYNLLFKKMSKLLYFFELVRLRKKKSFNSKSNSSFKIFITKFLDMKKKVNQKKEMELFWVFKNLFYKDEKNVHILESLSKFFDYDYDIKRLNIKTNTFNKIFILINNSYIYIEDKLCDLLKINNKFCDNFFNNYNKSWLTVSLNNKILKNKNKLLEQFLFNLYVLDIFKRIPLHLYDKRRVNLFNLFETKIYYSFIYFYLFSSKTRNFFKTSFITQYSKNLNLMSQVNFIKKSNFNL